MNRRLKQLSPTFAVDKRDGVAKSPSPNSAKVRLSQRLVNNTDQEATPIKRMSIPEYQDLIKRSPEDKTGSQRKLNGGIPVRWQDSVDQGSDGTATADTSKDNLLEDVIEKETCL